MNRISVCITHYNRADKLGQTLESLARQTLRPDEVLIWDDHSIIDPKCTVDLYRDRFPSLVYNRNVRNLGMPGNLNAVLSRAKHEYVANLHDADIFHPQLLEKWAAALDRHPKAGMVFCGLRRLSPSGRTVDTIVDAEEVTNGRLFFRTKLIGHLACPIWGTTMVRREVHRELLPFDPQFRNWADVDYWMRICLRHDIAYLAEPLITLDDSDTPERRFSWFRMFLMHKLYITNIRRHFAEDPKGLNEALAVQCSFFRRRFFRNLIKSISNARMPDLLAGLKYVPIVITNKTLLQTDRMLDRIPPHR